MEMEKLRAAIPGMRVVTEGNFGGGVGAVYMLNLLHYWSLPLTIAINFSLIVCD